VKSETDKIMSLDSLHWFLLPELALFIYRKIKTFNLLKRVIKNVLFSLKDSPSCKITLLKKRVSVSVNKERDKRKRE